MALPHARDGEQYTALPLHYLFGAILVGDSG
jgi:hypothetical protein